MVARKSWNPRTSTVCPRVWMCWVGCACIAHSMFLGRCRICNARLNVWKLCWRSSLSGTWNECTLWILSICTDKAVGPFCCCNFWNRSCICRSCCGSNAGFTCRRFGLLSCYLWPFPHQPFLTISWLLYFLVRFLFFQFLTYLQALLDMPTQSGLFSKVYDFNHFLNRWLLFAETCLGWFYTLCSTELSISEFLHFTRQCITHFLPCLLKMKETLLSFIIAHFLHSENQRVHVIVFSLRWF